MIHVVNICNDPAMCGDTWQVSAQAGRGGGGGVSASWEGGGCQRKQGGEGGFGVSAQAGRGGGRNASINCLVAALSCLRGAHE